ncbi:SREBP regulating gene protein-like [Amphiura filiformis]|uniref:SREBP regulating gene protein-like n=1 Tax=Amphiura filiformis TaxID=82378 RepID=UPI003B224789
MFPSRILRKRWVLAVIFLISLFYFLNSTLNQTPTGLISDQFDEAAPTKIQFPLRPRLRVLPNITTCRNSVQGRVLLVDEKGYVCKRNSVLASGCCDSEAEGSKQHSCDGCLGNGCCGIYEYCVSCCLQPDKEIVLQGVLGKASNTFKLLFQSVADHFELCLTKCRTSSESVQHENTYRDPSAKYCYGESPPDLMPPSR